MNNKKVTIGTHDGTFHCDDALACYMLQLLKEFANSEIVRTRNKEELRKCDIVVDVGAEFDHDRKRYDHHQREFNETFNSLDGNKKWKTKLSSAGLVYVYYGRDVIKSIISKFEKVEQPTDSMNLNENFEKFIEEIFDLVYENFIEEIDAVDNGIHATIEEPRYLITTTISKRVALLNPRWNENSDDKELMRRFAQAMKLVGHELEDRVRYYVFAWLPARELVKTAILGRFNCDASGEVITFPTSSIPWKEHIFEVERRLDIEGVIKYAVYEEKKNKWKIQCVPLKYDSFANRLTLPEAWRGLDDDKLSEVVGIPDCVFVHPNGFTGAHKTKEGAMYMVRESLKAQHN